VTMGLRESVRGNPYQITSLVEEAQGVRASPTHRDAAADVAGLRRNAEELAACGSVMRNRCLWPLGVEGPAGDADHGGLHRPRVDYAKVFSESATSSPRSMTATVEIRVVGDRSLRLVITTCRSSEPRRRRVGLTSRCFRAAAHLARSAVPLLAGVVSAIWALGICRLIGIHFEAARDRRRDADHVALVSHSVKNSIASMTSSAAAPATAREARRPRRTRGPLPTRACSASSPTRVHGGRRALPDPMLRSSRCCRSSGVDADDQRGLIRSVSFRNRRPHGTVHRDSPRCCVACSTSASGMATSRFRFAVIGCSSSSSPVGLYAFNLKIGDANPVSPSCGQSRVQPRSARSTRASRRRRMFIVVGEDGKEGLVKSNDVLLR